MSFTYFKFLFVNTFKKKSIWITWLLFLLTCTSFLIILPLFAKMNTLQVWANTTMAVCQTFMGMMAGLFTAVLAINIFKDTNEEGTELIVISKPISRFKLVMSKFVLFGCYCLMINLTAVAISAFTYFLPRTEHQFYIGLIVSMFIGNLVTFGIFGSIAVLLTIKFVKVGIIITNIMISLVFLIFQALTLFVFPTPLKELDNQHMSVSTYILHNRDTTTGEYTEDEVVQFTPSAVDPDQLHPCQATNWKEMKEYWEQSILSKDPTPVLNIADVASQVALTYMSYSTDAFAQRQADRMFAWTRFYDYTLTSPASPELHDDSIKDKKNIKWLYTSEQKIKMEEAEEEILAWPFDTIYLPENIGIEGIPPLTSTRLRGYGDTIPIGSISAKESLFSDEVYFEKEDWLKYAHPFDLMYDIVFDYRNYLEYYDLEDPEDPEYLPYENYASAFAISPKAVKEYYDIVWSCFMGQSGQYVNPSIETKMGDYGPTYFDINSVYDLNERFIQFKNYAFWKAYEEQQAAFSGVDMLVEEKAARQYVYNYADSSWLIPISYSDLYKYVLGVDLKLEGDWMMTANSNEGLLVNDTSAPAIDFMVKTCDYELSQAPDDQKVTLGLNSTISKVRKTENIFLNTCDVDENYLYDSLTKPVRQWNYTGHAYMQDFEWYPNLNGVLKDYLEVETNIPLGQNMQMFYYTTTPKVKYWIFSVVWGVISVMLFTGGVIVYNKYDVK